PVISRHQPTARYQAQDSIASPRERGAETVDLALAQAHGLHAPGAAAAIRLESAEGAGLVPGVGCETLVEHERVLQRQHAALRQVRQHGVGGIAYQYDAAGRPSG